MLGSFIIFIFILTLNTVILVPRFLLFYIQTTVSPPSLTYIPYSHLPSTPLFTPLSQIRKVNPPMGVNKAWGIKLKQNQVPPPCIKTDPDILLQGTGSKMSVYALTTRVPTNRQSYTAVAHDQGLAWSLSDSLAASTASTSSHKIGSAVSLDFYDVDSS